MKSTGQVDWKKTRIRASEYASDHDVWARLAPGDPAPRFAIDDVLDGKFEEPDRRDRIEGRNRLYVQRPGSLKEGRGFIVDHAPFEHQPANVIVDIVEKRMRGRELNAHQRGLVFGLKYYLSDKKSMSEVNPATIRGLLTALAA